MKVLLVSLLLSLSACDEIDGVLEVLSDFMLVDEDGRSHQITAGSYSADFSYSRRKKEVELEIDDFVGSKDIDFEFNVPHMNEIDFRQTEIEVDVSADDSGQGVVLNAIIEKDREELGSYRKRHGNLCRDPYSRYTYPQVVYDVSETSVSVDVEIRDDDEQGTVLATFQGEDCTRRYSERYCIDCYGRRYLHGCIHSGTTWCRR